MKVQRPTPPAVAVCRTPFAAHLRPQPVAALARARADGLRAAEVQRRGREAGLGEDAIRASERHADPFLADAARPRAVERRPRDEEALRAGLGRALGAELGAAAVPCPPLVPGVREAPRPEAHAAARTREVLALVERVEVLVRSGRPALRLSALGLDVEVRRTGPGAVALTLRGGAGALHAARLKAALEARGLSVSGLVLA